MWLPLLPLPVDTTALTIKEKLCFADLPAELRNEIYSHAIVRREPIMLPYAYQKKSFCEPALLNVCRWIRAEATPMYYASNIFEAPSPPSAHKFLKHLSPEKIARIRHFRPIDLVLPFNANRRWFAALRTNVNRLVDQVGKGALSSEAIYVPMRNESQKAEWCKLRDLEELEIVSQSDGDWSVEWQED
ncbi:hypothetical protein HII31_05385 [Pseudocercospora fuligena]|uniref:2EXR domain-containing protein n=1 Tax=Pseudocercospora fuligena TaxID=685502 RepID=A0A8H6RIW8_9PEZI|nr:hypothetical protein HII31_05385 [Pseudocercospora fuligena]